MDYKLQFQYLKSEEMAKRLFLLFNLGGERFAVTTEMITEITPLVEFTKVPKTDSHICGLFKYRGETIPVVDTCMLLFNKAYSRKICTRIIVLSRQQGGIVSRIGLIAEKVNKTESFDTDLISEHTLTQKHTPYLGKTLTDEQGEIQIIDLEQFMPDDLDDLKSLAISS